MKTRTDTFLAIMNVVAWLAVFGLVARAGAILISYSVSLRHSEATKNLYLGWDLSIVRQFDFWHYTSIVLLMVCILLAEAFTAYLVTRVLSKIKGTNPFTVDVARTIERIGYIILLIWVAAVLYNGHIEWLSKRISGLHETTFSGDSIFLAGVVFVFAQIFKKGVEIQTENELTV